jgi:magnesium chelatase family protein
MLARVHCGALMGVDAVLVEVEVDMSIGLPYFNVVGLPEGAAKESKVRVVSALKNAGYDLPQKDHGQSRTGRHPQERRLRASSLGRWSRGFEAQRLDRWVVGGSCHSIARSSHAGVLPLAIAARDRGFEGVIVPTANAPEAALVDRIHIYPVARLEEAVAHVTGEAPITPYQRGEGPGERSPTELDMAEVRGQGEIKEALELAAAGGHNVLLCGPPGSGKTMLARRLPGLLPLMPSTRRWR